MEHRPRDLSPHRIAHRNNSFADVSAGESCQRLVDAKLRGLRPHLVQADELHSIKGALRTSRAALCFDLPRGTLESLSQNAPATLRT